MQRNKKKCSDLNYAECTTFISNNILTSCLPKLDNSGCDEKSCSQMDLSSYNNYIPLTPIKKCNITSAGTECVKQDRNGGEMAKIIYSQKIMLNIGLVYLFLFF